MVRVQRHPEILSVITAGAGVGLVGYLGSYLIKPLFKQGTCSGMFVSCSLIPIIASTIFVWGERSPQALIVGSIVSFSSCLVGSHLIFNISFIHLSTALIAGIVGTAVLGTLFTVAALLFHLFLKVFLKNYVV